MRFTLRQLSYFVAAAEAGSVTLAAQNVNVSQPSVSEAIAKLEAEFGLQLFVRHRATGLSLTPAGTRFLAAAQALLRQAEGLHAIADEIATAVSGPLRIGSFRTFTPVFVTELAKAFRDAEPRVEVSIVEGDEAAMIARLQRGDIDLAFTYQLHVDASIAFEPVAALPTHVVLPAAHPLAARDALALHELAGEPFILLDLPLSREYLLSLFASDGVSPRIAARSENPETVRSLVACGFGFALMTSRPANRAALNGYGLAYVPLEGGRPPLAVGIATLKGSRKVRAAQAFEAFVKARVAAGGLPGLAPMASAALTSSLP